MDTRGGSNEHLLTVPIVELGDSASHTCGLQLKSVSNQDSDDIGCETSPSPSMDSDTEIASSPDDQQHAETLQQRKKEAVEHIMAALLRNLDIYLNEQTSPNDANSYQTISESQTTQSSTAVYAQSTTSNGKRKLSSQQSYSEDGEGQDDQDGQGNETRSKKQAGTQALRYACPYFKWNPRKYNKRPCSGPGWLTVRHVK